MLFLPEAPPSSPSANERRCFTSIHIEHKSNLKFYQNSRRRSLFAASQPVIIHQNCIALFTAWGPTPFRDSLSHQTLQHPGCGFCLSLKLVADCRRPWEQQSIFVTGWSIMVTSHEKGDGIDMNCSALQRKSCQPLSPADISGTGAPSPIVRRCHFEE